MDKTLTEHEIDLVGEMINVATENGLLAEVVWSFALLCRNNKPLELDEYKDCIEEALNEWDL